MNKMECTDSTDLQTLCLTKLTNITKYKLSIALYSIFQWPLYIKIMKIYMLN